MTQNKHLIQLPLLLVTYRLRPTDLPQYESFGARELQW